MDGQDQLLTDPGPRRTGVRRGEARGARRAHWRPGRRRSAWVVVDQGVSSLTNFAASVIVARSASQGAFGAFTVALLVYAVVVSLTNALVAQPLAIRVSARADQRDEVAAAAGAAIVCGSVAGLAVVAASLLVDGPAGPPLAVVGVFLPALALQDTWRFALFTMGRPVRAVVNDLAWAGSQAVLMALALRTAGGTVAAPTAAWAGGAAVAALVGLRQADVRPAVGSAASYLRRHLRLGWQLATEVLFRSGSTQLTMLLAGASLGAAGLGAIRGAYILFGPFTVVLVALTAAWIPEGSRLLARSPDRFLPVLRLVSGGLLVLPLTWGALLLTLPDVWGHRLLGDTWPAAREVITPFIVSTAGAGVTGGAVLGLRIVAAASEALKARAAASAVTIVAGVVGASRYGPPGVVWGIAAGWWINAAAAWWLLLTRRLRGPD